jgi:hypothetical protein
MTERNKDDIANALHGLSSGEHVEPEPDLSGTGQAHHFANAPQPAPPASQPAPPPATPVNRSGQPMRPRPQPQPQPRGGARPAAPAAQAAQARPSSPVQPARTQPARAPSPASASSAAAAAAGGGGFVADDTETTDVQPVDEDDRVVVPAARLSALGHQPHHRPRAARVPMFKTLQFRRTAIPILLTTGLILLAVVGLKFVVHPDSALAALPSGMIAALVGAAAVLMLVALLNMAQVRRQLAAEKQKP